MKRFLLALLTTMFAVFSGAEGLPQGLRWTSNKADVEKVLGPLKEYPQRPTGTTWGGTFQDGSEQGVKAFVDFQQSGELDYLNIYSADVAVGEVSDQYQEALIDLVKALGPPVYLPPVSSAREMGTKALWATRDTFVTLSIFRSSRADEDERVVISYTRRDASNPFR